LGSEGRRCALAVVVERLPAGFPAESRPLLLDWALEWAEDAAEAKRQMLAAHVRWYSRFEGDYVDVLQPKLETLSAQGQLAQWLAQPSTPAQLAEMAQRLLPALRGLETLDEALAAAARFAGEDVRRWFDQGHPPDIENLLIAAAVFNGAAYDGVAEAALRLDRLLTPESQEAEPPPRPPSRFRPSDHKLMRLQAIHAHLEQAAERSHYGEVVQEVVKLDNPGWQEAALRFVWGFDVYQEALLQWLEDYAHGPRSSLRVRAAAAVGALARSNLATIEGKLLRRWANSGAPRLRRAAGQALGIAMWDEVQAPAAARLLHHWAGQRDNVQLQWTAAAAYSGLAGLRFPQQTFADLKLLAASCHAEPSLLEPILRAVLNAYSAAFQQPERRLAVITELWEWSGEEVTRRSEAEQARSLQRTALLAFWLLLWPQRRDALWRQAVTDFGVPGEMQDMAVDLMRRAFRFRQPKGSVRDGMHPRSTARDGLHALILETARQADADLAAYLAGLLSALVAACQQEGEAGADELDRLFYYAGGWEDAKAAAPSLVNILL
ncbi:MAG: hypothetical protein GX657_16845, partial [Chloroflexi bacterium]|nr:hypothetical protein [Chloroflexota bacterium]